MTPLRKVVSFASPLAVMVVGKKIVVPFDRRVGERLGPGDMMNGDMLPIFVKSSMKLFPLLNGEPTSVAEVGRAPPTMACGEGGGRVGVLGREDGMLGGWSVKGEYTGAWARRYGSQKAAGVSRVGVIGVVPLVPQALKNVGPPKMPGEIGMAVCGKTNFAVS